MTEKERADANYKGLAICIFYGLVSISITFFNKAVLSVYEFHYPNTLTIAQMFFTLIFLLILRNRNVPENPPPISLKHCRQSFLLALSFALMAITGLSALSYVNVPVFSALRRGVTLIVMLGEYLLLGKRTERDESMSIYLMILGAVVAGWGDMHSSLIGYVLTLINCVVTAGYLVFIKRTSQETKLDNFSLMLYNNMLSFVPVMIVAMYTEYSGLVTFEHYFDIGFIACFMMSAVQAFLLNYLIFLCSTFNSPLATSVTGQIKTIVTTGLGLFMFGDVEFTRFLILGLFISTVASFWYGQIKYRQTIQPKPVVSPV